MVAHKKSTVVQPVSSEPRFSPPVPGAQTRRFRAQLEPDHTELKWTILRVPEGVSNGWTEMRRLRVRGEVNGVSFRTSLFPDRTRPGNYVLLINKQVQRAAGVHVGHLIEVSLEPDLEDRPSALPAELLKAFEGDRALRRWTEGLSESTRREMAKWIAGVKGTDAQSRRASQLAERLLQAMEGERVMPPVLEAIVAHSPKARAAWDRLTPVQRRGHLMGIFYYQTPEARIRRAQKAVDDALRITAKRVSPQG